ncbi:MAG: 3-methyl-2-oxobutanoate hydroxymethyltransferase, partial [Candidatus Omnitrophica bacterium]|nr:3-methyl-2-oxobutanoate hydroxymethyltransferase [Candidatus Omnitrophota bacterium]
KYIDLSPMILDALKKYREEVISQKFPAPEHTFSIKKEELEKLEK